MEKNDLLRAIPKVDELLKEPAIQALELGQSRITELVRASLEELRAGILAGTVTEMPDSAALAADICAVARKAALPSLRRVINATGIALHTNLGRACISEKAVAAVVEAASRYSTLEYDLEAGKRGSRHVHVEQLLCELTGAEGAMVVNNNAAAVLMILTAVGSGGEVITSRGELVEIGGSFRIPEIMEQCGCRLREVGATNKTHLRDYEKAIGPETRALLKVHTSNYRIMGFSESVGLRELVELGKQTGLPVIEDLGSGCLFDLERCGIHGEPLVGDSVKAGVDLISFSGDKLLGGPQAGIILGRKTWIEKLKKHPLARAMRVDKMTLAALEATLDSYRDMDRAAREIPTLRMLQMRPEELRVQAEALAERLRQAGVQAEAIPEQDQVGGGSVPTQMLDTWVAAVAPKNCSVDTLERRLRACEPAVVGRIVKDRYLLDPRTLWEDDYPILVKHLSEVDK